MYSQVSSVSQSVLSFGDTAAAADVVDWLALCAYLAQFHLLLFAFKGSYSSLVRLGLSQRSYIGKSLLIGNERHIFELFFRNLYLG